MRLLFYMFLLFTHIIYGQFPESVKVHSHNDYNQSKPLWDAYNGGASSIEVDVLLKNDTIYVTHDESEIILGGTIERLYLEPLKEITSMPEDGLSKLQLLVDVKSEARSTLDKLIYILENHKTLRNSKSISFVISGNRPPIEEYVNYPNYIFFDHQDFSNIEDAAIWNKIALISLPFYKFSEWDGKSRLTGLEYRKIRTAIDKAHSYKKPFRFWATPDTEMAWETFSRMGMDYINSDTPVKCSKFLESIKKEHQ